MVTRGFTVRGRKSNVSSGSRDVTYRRSAPALNVIKGVLLVDNSTSRKSHHCLSTAHLSVKERNEAVSQYIGSWNTVALLTSLARAVFKNLMWTIQSTSMARKEREKVISADYMGSSTCTRDQVLSFKDKWLRAIFSSYRSHDLECYQGETPKIRFNRSFSDSISAAVSRTHSLYSGW